MLFSNVISKKRYFGAPTVVLPLETSHLEEILSLALVTDVPILGQKGQRSRSHGHIELSNRRRVITDKKSQNHTVDFSRELFKK